MRESRTQFVVQRFGPAMGSLSWAVCQDRVDIQKEFVWDLDKIIKESFTSHDSTQNFLW